MLSIGGKARVGQRPSQESSRHAAYAVRDREIVSALIGDDLGHEHFQPRLVAPKHSSELLQHALSTDRPCGQSWGLFLRADGAGRVAMLDRPAPLDLAILALPLRAPPEWPHAGASAAARRAAIDPTKRAKTKTKTARTPYPKILPFLAFKS